MFSYGFPMGWVDATHRVYHLKEETVEVWRKNKKIKIPKLSKERLLFFRSSSSHFAFLMTPAVESLCTFLVLVEY